MRTCHDQLSTEHRFGISTHLFHESAADPRASRPHRRAWVRGGRAVRHALALRLPRRTGGRRARASGCPTRASSCTRCTRRSSSAWRSGQWVGSYSNASGDESRRKAAVAETEAALTMATRIAVSLSRAAPRECRRASRCRACDNQPGRRPAQRRGDRRGRPQRVDVQVAVEVIPNPLSSADSARPADRRGTRRHRRRDLSRLRPRASDGRPRRGDRDALGPPLDDARARQPREARRSPRAVSPAPSTGTWR